MSYKPNEKISKVNIELHIPDELPDTKNKNNIIIKTIINSYTNIELCINIDKTKLNINKIDNHAYIIELQPEIPVITPYRRRSCLFINTIDINDIDLFTCIDDMRYLKNELKNNCGFSNTNIVALTNNLSPRTRKTTILTDFIQVLDSAIPGDELVVAFSDDETDIRTVTDNGLEMAIPLHIKNDVSLFTIFNIDAYLEGRRYSNLIPRKYTLVNDTISDIYMYSINGQYIRKQNIWWEDIYLNSSI